MPPNEVTTTEMLGHSQISYQQVTNFVHEKVNQRSAEIQKSIHAIVKLVQEVLKDVEIQEPRFIPTLMESNGRYEGVSVFILLIQRSMSEWFSFVCWLLMNTKLFCTSIKWVSSTLLMMGLYR
jgi:hypothetical protein